VTAAPAPFDRAPVLAAWGAGVDSTAARVEIDERAPLEDWLARFNAGFVGC